MWEWRKVWLIWNLEEIARDILILSWITDEAYTLIPGIQLEITHMFKFFASVRGLTCFIYDVDKVVVLTNLVQTEKDISHSKNVFIFYWIVLK